jgi:hypothetical protein
MTNQLHADKINSQYSNSKSNFVGLQGRLEQSLSLHPAFRNMLDGGVDEFKRRQTDFKSIEDIELCKAVDATLDQILIDTTMQRQVNFKHILDILDNFRNTMVMPIQVYEDPERPGKYIAWDGQHTALDLYIICTMVFGVLPKDFVIPVNVYPTKHKLEIRRNFILLNGEAKAPLDFIDNFRQMVFGVRTDGATDQGWVDAEKKQQYFERASLFATSNKFGDEDKPGAFTLLADTIMTKNLSKAKDPEVTRMFAEYWTYLNQSRPVQAKEARQLYEYFNLCFEQDIKVDSKYLREFAEFTKEYFEANFGESGMFWNKVRLAYTNWYAKANPESYAEHGLKGFSTEMRTGIPFLIAQLKKSTKLKTPSYIPNNGFAVNPADLW